MSDDIDIPDEYDFSDEVALDPDEKNAGGKKDEWLKFTAKNQTVRCSFVYFHTHDANSVRQAIKKAKKKGETLTREQVIATAKEALQKRAEELGKKVDELTDIDKLDTSTAHFKMMKVHYKEGVGYALSRLGKDGPEADKIWKRMDDPKTYFSTLLLIYPTDNEGNLNKEALARQIKENKLNLVPWRFAPRIYEAIWKLNDGLRENNLALASQDIKLECKEPQYQKIDVSFAGAAIWQKNEALKTAVLQSAVNKYDKLIPFREMTTDQIRSKLGLGGSATEDISADNFQDMLDNV